jgi:molybdopterin-guanine dinucleotide biosynthesis protein A
VMAIDLPQMTAAFLKNLLIRCTSSRGVVIRHDDFFEPMATIYPKSLHVLATEHLSQERHAMQDFVREAVRRGQLRAVPLDEKDVPLFKNLNSPADLQDT